jgi:hypothetical protein
LTEENVKLKDIIEKMKRERKDFEESVEEVSNL